MLIHANSLKRVDTDQSDRIASLVRTIFPGWDKLRVVAIPVLYLLTDFLDRKLETELTVNAVALAMFLEERVGKVTNFIALNPYEMEEILPQPRSDLRVPSLRWALIPVIIYGDEDGYDSLFEYLTRIEAELEGNLDALSEELKDIYGFELAQAFPPTMFEDLFDELEEIEQALGFKETTAS